MQQFRKITFRWSWQSGHTKTKNY